MADPDRTEFFIQCPNGCAKGTPIRYADETAHCSRCGAALVVVEGEDA